MGTLDALFEVSWEVCHKVGGIHTSISTKARTLTQRFGDAYVAVGPWLLSEGRLEGVFEAESGFERFADSCREAGVPVRVGRWLIPGRPRTVLVEFSGLYTGKNAVLAELWDRYRVDSLFGGWEYVEPLLFGHAASIVIERWWRTFHAAPERQAAAIFHEWMTGAGLLGLASRAPEIGRVAVTHATVVGRALGATGQRLPEGLAGRPLVEVATTLNVRASHSLESAFAREADVFTTVSEIAATECELLHGRRPDLLVPNGLDLQVLAERVGGVSPVQAREKLLDVATRYLGQELHDPLILSTGGRLEMHNKGYDVLLDAVARLHTTPGRPIVLFAFVLSGHGGVRPEVAERLAGTAAKGAVSGVSTHVIFDAENDPIARRCRERGLDNGSGGRVRVIHVPALLDGRDGVLGLSYEAALQGADLACFASFYEAWGYTPQESLALGVETITTDCAGFGLWARAQGWDAANGIHVLQRRDLTAIDASESLATLIQTLEAQPPATAQQRASRQACVRATEWTALVRPYEQAVADAAAAGQLRRPPGHPRGSAQAPPSRVHRASEPRPRLVPLEIPAVLPRELAGLRTLAANWRWAWDTDAQELFSSLSPRTFAAVGRNPVRLLREAPQADFARCAADAAYRKRLDLLLARLAKSCAPAAAAGGLSPSDPVAYLSAEFGIHESLPIYSGGLGVLAGDHVKSASDLGVPLVAVGILYRQGYLRQQLRDGVEQVALPDVLDPERVALTPVLGVEGEPLEFTIQLPATRLHLRAWRADVGRVPLYLLDADCSANRPEDRCVTDVLYGGDNEHRIRQEIVLGRGAVRLLELLSIRPAVWHVNEGHGAFAVLERVGQMVHAHGLSFAQAREFVRATTLFTTHTPVPAGHDRFSEDLMRRYFSDVPDWLGVAWETFFRLGEAPDSPGVFDMTLLALHFCSFVNGVSRRHQEVSRELLQSRCPQHLVQEFPVQAVTNGVHLSTWTHPQIARALEAKEGGVTGDDFARRAAALDLSDLWQRRQVMKREFLAGLRARLDATGAEALPRSRSDPSASDGLDPDALYIGFARRFATYKRADMLFRDPARLQRLLQRSDRPVRLLFAGKAHPRDAAGIDLLARVAGYARRRELAGRVLVLENYDIGLGRLLVQGVDVWLNTPRPPEEASGTSGMKAAANGALNLSIGDGWWLEGHDGANGWSFGADGEEIDMARRDALDAEALYRLLEDDVVPLFFERTSTGVPQVWLKRVRHALHSIPPVFSAARMVGEYRDRAYIPMAAQRHELHAEEFAALRAVAEERERVRRGFDAIRIISSELPDQGTAPLGTPMRIALEAQLGALSPDDVCVELVLLAQSEVGGRVDSARVQVPLQPRPAHAGGVTRFEARHSFSGPGRYLTGLRIRPRREGSSAPDLHDRVIWA